MAGAEPAPFWRDGSWRCELHLTTGVPVLKVFRGARCVLQEPTFPGAIAHRRADALRVLTYEARSLTPPDYERRLALGDRESDPKLRPRVWFLQPFLVGVSHQSS